eukprot:TRINITY_DN1079_c0_g1_i1.p1 TRINITY_DN1079_c0_g1~~TRINITY_DN1079_c0_g1_i1.p1  ORF type:complete len:489 (+),score=118.30 TRINITY_DN1079_c0_g1_i1:59-1468(+)
MSKKVKSDKMKDVLQGAGTLTVTVLEARELAAMDSNGKSDPFCKISSSFGSQHFQTHTIKKTLSPSWNESFPIYVGKMEATHSITIKLYDRDLVSNDFLGEVTIPLSKLINHSGDSLTKWFDLVDEPTKTYNKGEKRTGQLKLTLHYPKLASLRGAISREDPKKYYTFESVLGTGAFATVKRGVNKETGVAYAIKVIRKKKLADESKKLLEREIAVMAKLHHPHIVELIQAYDTPKYTYLVLELVTGGELLDELINRERPYSEYDAVGFVKQILRGVGYMHNMGIAHRDLKPENILLDSTKTSIKITDFGLSQDFESTGADMMTACGTATYVAPEVLMSGGYTSACDIWSIGVITYVLLSSHIPFDGNTENLVFQKIIRAQYRFPSPMWDNISEEAMNFIKKIFLVDPKQRMSVDECLDHDWMHIDGESHKTPLDGLQRGLSNFQESQRSLKPIPNTMEYSDSESDSYE